MSRKILSIEKTLSIKVLFIMDPNFGGVWGFTSQKMLDLSEPEREELVKIAKKEDWETQKSIQQSIINDKILEGYEKYKIDEGLSRVERSGRACMDLLDRCLKLADANLDIVFEGSPFDLGASNSSTRARIINLTVKAVKAAHEAIADINELRDQHGLDRLGREAAKRRVFEETFTKIASGFESLRNDFQSDVKSLDS